MKEIQPIPFSEHNHCLFGFGDIEDLPVLRTKDRVISCWSIPFLKRIKLLFTGKIWFCAKGTTHPPMFIEVDKPFRVNE